MVTQGYASQEYQNVYAKHGEIKNGFVHRQIPETSYVDRISVYPFFSEHILHEHSNEITTTLITDPLGDHFNLARFCLAHNGYLKHQEVYKEHAVVDLAKFDESKLPENHKRNIKKCDKNHIYTEVVANPEGYAKYACVGYKNLIKRHNISPDAWTHYSKEQIWDLVLKVPGAVLFNTMQNSDEYDREDSLLGLALFYIQGSSIYYHASFPYSEDFYKLQANFDTMFTAIKFFKALGLDRLEIGSVPDGASGEGLRRFKHGFANMNLNNYIYKIIHQPSTYEELSKNKTTTMFPAYRG
jgi:hypothetical protein